MEIEEGETNIQLVNIGPNSKIKKHESNWSNNQKSMTKEVYYKHSCDLN